MTIDEAIKQEKERTVDCRQGAEVVKNMIYATWERENLPKQYIERAEYHEQIAEWLEELKDYRRDCNSFFGEGLNQGYDEGYNIAIDDTQKHISALYKDCLNGTAGDDVLAWNKALDKVIEVIKAGGNNDNR